MSKDFGFYLQSGASGCTKGLAEYFINVQQAVGHILQLQCCRSKERSACGTLGKHSITPLEQPDAPVCTLEGQSNVPPSLNTKSVVTFISALGIADGCHVRRRKREDPSGGGGGGGGEQDACGRAGSRAGEGPAGAVTGKGDGWRGRRGRLGEGGKERTPGPTRTPRRGVE